MKNSIVQYLDIAARQWGDRIAFSDKETEITFAAYRENARKIATYLIEKIGVFRAPVAVYLPKTVKTLNTFMGILYSGNFYCPIPYHSPVDRAKRIIEISATSCVITDAAHLDTVKGFGVPNEQIRLLEDILQTEADDEKIDKVVSRVIDTDPAYVLFTSGSTGLPKGVTLPHRAVIDYMEWVTEEFSIDSSYVFANQAPFHFDASMPDIYLPLFTGCKLYIAAETLFMFPGRLVDELNKNRVNSIIWVPSALMILSNHDVFSKKKLDELRLCMFCGEVMPNKQLNVWRRYYPDAVYVNLYGPTEAAYACTYYVIDRAFEDYEPLPLGKACRNTDIMILDDEGRRITEPDVIGELCIRGSSLALGYYTQMEHPAFVNDPTHTKYPEKIYRTGDLAYLNRAGELMFSGRKDFQIKHLGYRIELGEIETAILSLPGIRNVACLYDAEKDEIVAFYEADAALDREEILGGVARRIPAYMHPGRFVRFDKMPMNLNGKVDRTLLRSKL